MRKWMASNRCREISPNKVRRTFSRMLPVWSAENASDENKASTHSHATVGNHEIKRLRRTGGAEASRLETDNSIYLLNPVIRGFPRDDHVMHVAFTQSGAADADELCSLLQIGNRFGSAISHA